MQFDPCVFDLKPTCLPLDILTAPYRFAFGHVIEVFESTNSFCERITHLFLFMIELIPVANYLICYLDYTWTVEHFKTNINLPEYLAIYKERHDKVISSESEHAMELELVRNSYFRKTKEFFEDAKASFSATRDAETQKWVIQEIFNYNSREGCLFYKYALDKSEPASSPEVDENFVLQEFNKWKGSLKKSFPSQEAEMNLFSTKLLEKIFGCYSSIEDVVKSMHLTTQLQELLFPENDEESQEKRTEFSTKFQESIDLLVSDLTNIVTGSHLPEGTTPGHRLSKSETMSTAIPENEKLPSQEINQLVDSLTARLKIFLRLNLPNKNLTSQVECRMDSLKTAIYLIGACLHKDDLSSNIGSEADSQ